MKQEDGSTDESTMKRLPDINTKINYNEKCEENDDKHRRNNRFDMGESRRSSCPDLSHNNLSLGRPSIRRNDATQKTVIFPPIKPPVQNMCKSKSSKYGHVSSKYGQQDRDELPPLVERSFVLHENLPVLKVDASLYFLHVMKEIVRT